MCLGCGRLPCPGHGRGIRIDDVVDGPVFPGLLLASTSMSSFDLESLIHLEQSYVIVLYSWLDNPCCHRFYDTGYADGFAHGRIHGLIEGRALGREKGYEMWEELGFYEGFAIMWQAVFEAKGKEDE